MCNESVLSGVVGRAERAILPVRKECRSDNPSRARRSACAVPISFRPEHVPTLELSTELRMNHRATDIDVDRPLRWRIAVAMCRQKRRRRRRAVKGGCISRPKQLGKIEVRGTPRRQMAGLHMGFHGTRTGGPGAT